MFCYTSNTSLTPFLTAAMLVALTVMSVTAQGSAQTEDCATKLVSCYSYINGTGTPPSSCCNPLKDAVTNQKPCLCGLYGDPNILKGVGVNITQALNLPVRCKIPTDSNPSDFCKGVTPSGSPSSNSSSTPSGGSSSGTGSGSGSNSAATTTGTLFASSLLMFVTYVVAY